MTYRLVYCNFMYHHIHVIGQAILYVLCSYQLMIMPSTLNYLTSNAMMLSVAIDVIMRVLNGRVSVWIMGVWIAVTMIMPSILNYFNYWCKQEYIILYREVANNIFCWIFDAHDNMCNCKKYLIHTFCHNSLFLYHFVTH